MPFTIPNLASAAYPFQAEPDSVDFTVMTAASGQSGVANGCAVSPNSPAAMNVLVASGTILASGALVSVSGATVTIATADPTNPRFDLIVSSNAGALSATTGTPAVHPIFPSIPANSIVLAAVYVPSGSTSVVANQIIDKRVLVMQEAYINVASYGATGNGTTDDTSALQNAINAAQTRGGGVVFLPAGTYKISAPLTISNSGITIAGAGWGGPTGGGGTFGTVISLANGVNDYAIKFTPAASVRLDGVTIRDLKINCNGANQTGGGGISAFGSAYGLFDHLWIEVPYQDGINFTSDNLGGFGHHHVVRGCWFHGGTSSPLAGGGRGVACISADEIRVSHCVFEQCGTSGGTFNGAAFYDSAGLQTLEGCVFVANPAVNGVEQAKFSANNGSVIVGCTFDGGTGSQLDLAVSGTLSACTVTTCQFYQPINTAACLTLGGQGHTISGNIFRSSHTASASKCAIDASGAAGVSYAIGNTIITDGAWSVGLYNGVANLSISGTANWLNVKDFGATGNGTTDDTAAISAAISALPANGGTVYFPAGTYKVSSTISITAFQRLLGAGVNATQIVSSAATFNIIHAGNRQVDGTMRNDMCVEKMTVSHVGGASSFSCIWVDGGGQGTHIDDVVTNQGKYGFLLTDLDRCEFHNIRASNQRTAGIRCETGLENTYGTVAFYDCSVAISDNNGIGWWFSTNADQASPNAFDRISIYNTLFFMSTGVTGGVGLQIDNPGANQMSLYSCLFEQNITQVKLTKFTDISFYNCTFLDANGACVDIFQFNTDNHSLAIYGCRLQQATNCFHTLSGFPSLSINGLNSNQGNITNLYSGSFNWRTGTDTNFAGGKNIDSGNSNNPWSHVWQCQLDMVESGVNNLTNGASLSPFQTGVIRCQETGNVTGIILGTGNDTGELLCVRNESAFTITFDVPGTSHVANGTSCVIAANSIKWFSWSSQNNLWYPTM